MRWSRPESAVRTLVKTRSPASSTGLPRGATLPVAGLAALVVMIPFAAGAQQADDACSGLACLFGAASRTVVAPGQGDGTQGDRTQGDRIQGDRTQGDRTQGAPAQGDQAQGGPTVTAPAVGTVSDPSSDQAVKVRKPARAPITIAAGPAETARLRGLAAALPRERFRIVPISEGSGPAGTDFVVVKAIGAAGADAKARLFTEQLHIVAGNRVRTTADLAGKVVGFVGNGEAERNAARQAFAALNMPVRDTSLDLANALDGLSTGDIDAVVVLAPQPVAQLETIKAAGLHLVPWPDGGAIPDGGTLSAIEGARYPSLAGAGETIRALGIDAVLTMSAKGAKDPAARAFLASLPQNAAALSRHGFDRLRVEVGKRGLLASAERH